MSKYCVGIVLYNPETIRLNKLFYNLKSIDVTIYLYLNSLFIDNDFLQLVNRNIVILGTKENLGLAFGLNSISYQAINDGFDWILFLDQDSIVGDDIFDVYNKYTSLENVGLISPFIKEEEIPMDYIKRSDSEYDYIINHITSGSYINLIYLKKLGYFDELFFIDSLDTDLSIRFALNGIKQIRINSVIMLHRTGDIEISSFLYLKREKGKLKIKRLIRTNHSYFRVRFIFRNYVLMMRKYWFFTFRETRLLIRLIYFPWLKSILLLLLVEKNKLNKFLTLIKATKEALFINISKYTF